MHAHANVDCFPCCLCHRRLAHVMAMRPMKLRPRCLRANLYICIGRGFLLGLFRLDVCSISALRMSLTPRCQNQNTVRMLRRLLRPRTKYHGSNTHIVNNQHWQWIIAIKKENRSWMRALRVYSSTSGQWKQCDENAPTTGSPTCWWKLLAPPPNAWQVQGPSWWWTARAFEIVWSIRWQQGPYCIICLHCSYHCTTPWIQRVSNQNC